MLCTYQNKCNCATLTSYKIDGIHFELNKCTFVIHNMKGMASTLWWITVVQNPVASIGIYINSGSVYETPGTMGVSHLLEKMAFKTTTNRSHLRLIREIEAIGGNVTASASREQMSYTYDALKTHLPAMVEVLVDSVRNPAFLDWEVKEQVLFYFVLVFWSNSCNPGCLAFDEMTRLILGPSKMAEPGSIFRWIFFSLWLGGEGEGVEGIKLWFPLSFYYYFFFLLVRTWFNCKMPAKQTAPFYIEAPCTKMVLNSYFRLVYSKYSEADVSVTAITNLLPSYIFMFSSALMF